MLKRQPYQQQKNTILRGLAGLFILPHYLAKLNQKGIEQGTPRKPITESSLIYQHEMIDEMSDENAAGSSSGIWCGSTEPRIEIAPVFSAAICA